MGTTAADGPPDLRKHPFVMFVPFVVHLSGLTTNGAENHEQLREALRTSESES